MLRRFQNYCRSHRLHDEGSRWLLAVSGGIDSMSLAHLCYESGWACGVAHCHFGLRAADADADEAFVGQWAHEHGMPFFSIRFDTRKYAAAKHLSVQMAARELRYAWFEELRASQHYTAIAVAHHADDSAETVLLNLARGTGVKGLCGMAPKNGAVVRPLLFATRREVAAYAAARVLPYREDASNAKTDYARNRIRHNVVPELQKINPSATESILQTARHLRQSYAVIEAEREKIVGRCVTCRNGDVHITIAALKETPCVEFWLFEILQPFHFSGAVVHELAGALDGQPGKRFYSPTHEAIKDRATIIVAPIAENRNDNDVTQIDRGCRATTSPIALRLDYRLNTPLFVPSRERTTATLAADRLQFPLTLRRRRDGDVFQPFGMNGFKKVSDFLIDEKTPRHEKDRQYVLLSGDDIVWLIGRRIDERYRVTDDTKEILIVEC
jgi:tRNA(Ile)-lysidine synthase